jgi:hypothetical protein
MKEPEEMAIARKQFGKHVSTGTNSQEMTPSIWFTVTLRKEVCMLSCWSVTIAEGETSSCNVTRLQL